MKIRIAPAQTQKQVLTPSMKQSIEVLLLPIMELNTVIEQELQNNPLLEVDDEKDSDNSTEDFDSLYDQINRLADLPTTPIYEGNGDDEVVEEKPITRGAPLEDYLLQQLRLETNDREELMIGELIIGNLDEDGYITLSCEDIAKILGIENVKKVEGVLDIIQNFEPSGIASRSLRECLLTQVHYKFNGKNPLIQLIINEYLDELGRKKYTEIAKKLKVPLEDVKKMAVQIASLEPKPARNYRPIEANIYIRPDIFVTKTEEDQYNVRVNQENLPTLRINPTYKRMLRQPNRTQEELNFIREKIKNALIFMRSIEQRKSTIEQIANYIIKYQKEFFDHGHMSIKPLTLKTIAQTIDRNESTVSRAINNKYIETPQGLFPLKFFFSAGIAENANGENTTVATRCIKEEIKDLIESENKKSPLSDQDIQKYFEDKKMPVARRTISKYRQALKILPSHLRKI